MILHIFKSPWTFLKRSLGLTMHGYIIIQHVTTIFLETAWIHMWISILKLRNKSIFPVLKYCKAYGRARYRLLPYGHTLLLRGLQGSHSRSLQWHHNERDGVSNHRYLDCVLNRLSRRRSKKISKLRVSGLYEGNSNAFSRMKIFQFWTIFHWSLFLGDHLTKSSLIQAMAWYQADDKPLPESMVIMGLNMSIDSV